MLSRSTGWHSTVVVDGHEQNEPSGPFGMRTDAMLNFAPFLLALFVLGGGGTQGKPRITLEMLASELGDAGASLGGVFRWVFAVAACCLVVGFVCLLLMEERPLRGRQQSATTPVAAE